MITHFQLKPLYKNNQLPGWHLSFFYKGQSIKATYQKDGTINWGETYTISQEEKQKLKTQIHELMLYHVYD